jgi:hypothetical protein
MLSAKIAERESKEGDLFRVMLRDVVDPKHPLVIFANSINWEVIEKNIPPLFCATTSNAALDLNKQDNGNRKFITCTAFGALCKR